MSSDGPIAMSSSDGPILRALSSPTLHQATTPNAASDRAAADAQPEAATAAGEADVELADPIASTIVPDGGEEMAEGAEEEDGGEMTVGAEEEDGEMVIDAPQEGSRIEVWWPGDERYYPATIQYFNTTSGCHDLYYIDDAVEETIDLREEIWRPAPRVGSIISLYREDVEAFVQCKVTSIDDGVAGLRFVESAVDEQQLDLRYELWKPFPGDPLPPEEPAAEEPRLSFHPPAAPQHQEVTEESLDDLVLFVEKNGGTAQMLAGWRCWRHLRGVQNGKPDRGGSYLVFEDPNGNKKRSRKEVLQALKLTGGPAKNKPSSSASSQGAAAAGAKTSAREKNRPKKSADGFTSDDGAEAGDDAAAGVQEEKEKDESNPWPNLLCANVPERDGGFSYCCLPAFHTGPHNIDPGPRKRQRVKLP